MISHSASRLLEMLEAGETTSVEIVKALHARADATESDVNAYSMEFRDSSLKGAEEADRAREEGRSLGPLHGLPISFKESLDIKGYASTLGLASRAKNRAARDAIIVRIFKEAGAIPIGKTNVPQTLLAPMESGNAIYGDTKNPWRLSHGPGGSSGGEAAALAVGSSIMGVGGDIGGSIRTPAALCGVAGLKPTIGRWSKIGSRGALPGQEGVIAVIGPMARTSEDLSMMMNAVAKSQQHYLDPSLPPVGWTDPDSIDVKKLRIGFYEDDGFLTPAKSVQRGVQLAAEALQDFGCEVRHFVPKNVDEIVSLYFSLLNADGTKTVMEQLDGEDFHPMLRTIVRMAKMPEVARRALPRVLRLAGEKRAATIVESLGGCTVQDYWKMIVRRNTLRRLEYQSWKDQEVDVVICPVFVTPAAPIGESHDFTIGFVNVARYSFLDLPAGAIPITRVQLRDTKRSALEDRFDKRASHIEAQSAGLPIGVQVVGRPWEEDKVLAVMKTLEQHFRTTTDFPMTPVDPTG